MENVDVANVQYKILILGHIRLPPRLLPQPNIKKKKKKKPQFRKLNISTFKLLFCSLFIIFSSFVRCSSPTQINYAFTIFLTLSMFLST